MTVDSILTRLHLKFNQHLLPDRSTVARHVKKLESVPDEQTAQDLPFQWGALEESGWEHGRLMLDVWAYVETLTYPVALTRRLAKWTCRVAQSLGQGPDLFVPSPVGPRWYRTPESPPGGVIDAPIESDVLSIAIEYSWRETASAVLGMPFDTRDSDIWLAFAPWKGVNWLKRFHETKERHSIQPVVWHLSDRQRSSTVSPVPVSAIAVPAGPEPEVVRLLNDYWVRATDGLLSSQIYHYRTSRGPGAAQWQALGEANTGPWHFLYLDQIAAAGAAGVQRGSADPVGPTGTAGPIGPSGGRIGPGP